MSTPLCITIKTWNKENYNKFVKYLISLQDVKYKDFHSSLVLNSKYEMIGIRVPIMRDVAKKISKSNIEEFLEYAQNKYYEEVMIQGLIISHIKDEKMFYFASSSLFSSVFSGAGAGAGAAAFFSFFLRGFFLYLRIKLAAHIKKSITTRVTITRQSFKTPPSRAKNSLIFIVYLSADSSQF